MPNTAEEILSLAEAKRHLRIDDDSQDGNSLVSSCVENAVSDVMRRTGLPLIDRIIRLDLFRPYNSMDAIFVGVMPGELRSIQSILYWTADSDLRDDPGGSITISDLGRMDLKFAAVWPPVDGWPVVLKNSTLQVNLTIGFDIGPTEKSILQGIILTTKTILRKPRGNTAARPST